MARRLFLLGLALLPILARSETFDIEVLFVEPLAALAITEEQLPLRKAAELPAQALRFDAPRPANPGQAKALWDSIGQGPTLRWVTPGLSPEVDDFLDQLAQLRSLEGRGLETLQSIQTLRWAGTPGPPRPLAFFLAPEGRSVPAFGLQQAPALTPALALREAGADDFERWRPLTARELRFGARATDPSSKCGIRHSGAFWLARRARGERAHPSPRPLAPGKRGDPRAHGQPWGRSSALPAPIGNGFSSRGEWLA